MAVGTYAELKATVKKWLMNNDAVDTSAEEIVILAQSYLNTVLRCREMVTTTDLTPSSGECTLPTDYAAFKRVVELNSFRNPLDYISPEASDICYPYRESGTPSDFTIWGDTLRAFPTTANDIELTYYRRLTAFATEGAYDWLLTRYPHVYVAACKMIAADLTKNDDDYAKSQTQLDDAIEKLNEQDDQNEMMSAPARNEGLTP